MNIDGKNRKKLKIFHEISQKFFGISRGIFYFFMFLCFYVFMFLCFYVFMFLCFYFYKISCNGIITKSRCCILGCGIVNSGVCSCKSSKSKISKSKILEGYKFSDSLLC